MIFDQFKRPLKDLRISVIDRCNFRCPYCMPAEQFHHSYHFLEKKDWLSFDEIERLARIFVDLGVKKLRLTGGEPLLRPDIERLIAKLNSISGVQDLALTTNGVYLPAMAKLLKEAGLKRLTISLDTLDPQTYKILSGEKGRVADVLTGIKAAETAGFKCLKINAVIVRGINEGGILDLVRYFRGTGHVLRFIEYMDVGNQNNWDLKSVVTSDEILNVIGSEYPLKRIGGTENGETSQRYIFEDGAGGIELISSVSHAFCGTCNRLRLSADGKLYTCLFATKGTDLQEEIRKGSTDDNIKLRIQYLWGARQDKYSQERSLKRLEHSAPKVEMYRIGG